MVLFSKEAAATPRRWPLAALLALTLIRLAVAATAPLAPDEAYYWVWSRALAPGFFDHPPMVALFIRAGTAIAGDTAFGIRLLGPIAACLATLMIWDAAERVLPGRNAGLAAAILLNAMPIFGVLMTVMTPDAPLLLYWCGGLWAMARIATGGAAWWWLAAGAFAGLDMASKYTGLLFVIGTLVWLATAGRRWLRRPAPYLGAALAAAIFSPVLWWNWHHGWVSFVKQGGRVGAWRPARAAQFLGELIGGQIGLASPLLFILCVAGLVLAWRRARRGDHGAALVASLALVPAVVMIEHALGDRVQANWPAIVYPAAAIVAAGLSGPMWRKLGIAGVALGLALTALIYAAAAVTVFPVPPKNDPIAMQMRGWTGLATAVEAARQAAGADFVAADKYSLAAELALASPRRVPVVGIAPRWADFNLKKARLAGRVGLLVVRPGRDPAPSRQGWNGIAPAGTARRREAGRTIVRYRLYRVTGGGPGVAVFLPRPRR
ncbi:MAG: glycosyltransferase family 39 protein [Stellaceae bacterium]